MVWLVAILFAYVALWVLRAQSGDYSAISAVPTNLLLVLGFSTGTAVAAKGITYGYTSSNKLAKPSANNSLGTKSGLLKDDSGTPELAKIQMIGFTIVAIGIFVATLIHQIASNPVNADLPNIDSSLLVLMGISQGGYLGKKLVTLGTPGLYPIVMPSASPNDTVTVQGTSLGDSQNGSELLLDGVPTATTDWSDSSIKFVVPGNDPRGAAWKTPQQVKVSVVVAGESSNSVPLTIA
jgi:hypothetical protein